MFLSSQTDFTREGDEQSARLKSLELYKMKEGVVVSCPLCEAELPTPIPRVVDIVESLRKVDGLLEAAHRESPHIQEHINGLIGEIERLTDELKEVQRELAHAVSEDRNAQAAQNQLILRAGYLGKLVDFLDIVQTNGESDDSAEQIQESKLLIESVRQKINSDETLSRMETFLNFINQKMTEYSKKLELEHSGSTLRLDVKRLTVVADTEDGPIPVPSIYSIVPPNDGSARGSGTAAPCPTGMPLGSAVRPTPSSGSP